LGICRGQLTELASAGQRGTELASAGVQALTASDFLGLWPLILGSAAEPSGSAASLTPYVATSTSHFMSSGQGRTRVEPLHRQSIIIIVNNIEVRQRGLPDPQLSLHKAKSGMQLDVSQQWSLLLQRTCRKGFSGLLQNACSQ